MNIDILNASWLTTYGGKIFQEITEYSPKMISSVLILFIGLYVISVINKIIRSVMLKRTHDTILTNFLGDIVLWGLRILLFVTVISKLGIETSSFVAILGAMGLAVGLSLQGSLSNFAGGILIIIFKPFKEGDLIEAQGTTATVSDIQIFVTKLITDNNQVVFIPNSILSNGIITNFSMQGTQRADLTFAIAYNSDIKKAKEIIQNVLDNHPKILKTPESRVFVKNLTDSAIELSIRPWAKHEDFKLMVSEIIEECKMAFDAAEISIQPFVKEMSASS